MGHRRAGVRGQGSVRAGRRAQGAGEGGPIDRPIKKPRGADAGRRGYILDPAIMQIVRAPLVGEVLAVERSRWSLGRRARRTGLGAGATCRAHGFVARPLRREIGDFQPIPHTSGLP